MKNMRFVTAGNIIPLEITEEILSRLPVKSLGRSKSVSKSWNSLISDPRFIKKHVHHTHHKITTLILVPKDKSLLLINTNEFLPYHRDDHGILATAKQLNYSSPLIKWEEILGSCNGLVLAKDEKKRIFLMNPTTNELWEVPLNPFALPDARSSYGFGYDSFTDDYKVVRLVFKRENVFKRVSQDDSTGSYVSVYSLRKNSWRKLPDSPPYLDFIPGALVGHNYHWIGVVRYNNSYLWSGDSSAIVAFNLVDEVFSEINPSDLFKEEFITSKYALEIGGTLGVFLCVEDPSQMSAASYVVWVMQEYGVAKSWACNYNFSDRHVSYGRPVCLVGGSDRDVVLHDDYKVIVYNIDEDRYRYVDIVGGSTKYTVGGYFVESFESPKRFITAPN